VAQELLWPDDGGGPTNKKLIAPKIPVRRWTPERGGCSS
jgi:hypothetical protein